MSLALDRQIKPIYDALDTGSNKSAIVACNKLIKKYPKNDLIKALKALALVRSQKVEESLVLCDEILATKPSDDPTLTAMMHVLRGLGRHKDTVTMFEEAYKQQPANEELGAQTFFANIRAGNWKLAQQIATKLHKQFQEDRYLYWNVISAVLQADDPSTPSSMRSLLYKLAHRLITSSNTPYLNADRFYLHLSILRELESWDETQKLIDSEIGKIICDTNLLCNEIRRDIWKRRGLIKEEGEHAEKRITEQKRDRNWLEFLAVLDATFTSKVESEISTAVDHARNLFNKVAEEDGIEDRTGLLALLELEKRAQAHGVSTGSLLSLLKRYFQEVGGKACCYEDLKPYLELGRNDLTEWIIFLKSQTQAFDTTENLRRTININKIHRYLLSVDEVTIESESSFLALYINQYAQSLPLGKDLPTTELQPADDLALLAGSNFISLWKLTNDEKYLVDAVIFLEYALSKSINSFQTRLLLIRIYRLLGASSLAIEHYRALQVKQVQNDTLSHFILSRASNFSLASSGDLTLSSECLESAQIYLANSQETNDFIIRAFTAEKYSQIPEFLSFEDQLDNSLQRDLVKIEHLRMRLTHETIISDIIDMELIELKFIFDRTHYDHRDFEILANYHPRSLPSVNEQTLLHKLPAEGSGWLHTFLQLYIRALQQASDLDDTVEEKLLIGDRPKQSSDPEKKRPLRERLLEKKIENLKELTPDEQALVAFARVIADWLEPHHNFVRPPPAIVLAEAAKQTELRTGHPLKGIDIPQITNGASNKKDEDAPPITDAPPEIGEFFSKMKFRFQMLQQNSSTPIPELLHVATIVQEAFILFTIETLRFKAPSVVKIHKLGILVNTFKTLRTEVLDVLRIVSAGLVQRSESENTLESRSTLVAAFVQAFPQAGIDNDFIVGVARKLGESRKKVVEGIGKGMQRIGVAYAS